MELATDSATADHLCVLVHGYARILFKWLTLTSLLTVATSLWGNPIHLKNVTKVLRERYGEDKLHILVAKRNSGSFTYDGIELGGERVCREIEEELEKLSKVGQTVKKLSVVGYSLGGLVARYAVGLLESRGIFEDIEAIVIDEINPPTPLPLLQTAKTKGVGFLLYKLTVLPELYHNCDAPSRSEVSTAVMG